MSPFNLQLNQLRSLTVANLKIRYRKTWIGFLWVLLNPVILLTVQSFIFLHVLNVSRNHYLLYLISGFLPWIFLSQTWELVAGILKEQPQT
jgi:lipopolysaccharide transport system permease protein